MNDEHGTLQAFLRKERAMLGSTDPRTGSFRALGLIGWAIILGLALAWEGLGMVYARGQWPSLSDLLRATSRPFLGRWLLLALWLWVGWHLFVRGWQLFLRGRPEGGGILPPGSLAVGQILRQVVVPALGTYLLFLAMIALYSSQVVRGRDAAPAESTSPGAVGRPPGAIRLVRHVVLTMALGYAGFLGLVGSYYAVVAGQTPAFVRQATSGGAFIAFAVALPGLLLLSAAHALGRRLRASSWPISPRRRHRADSP